MPSRLEHVPRALHVDRQVLGRQLDRGHDVANAGKVKDAGRTGERLGIRLQIPDVALVEVNIGVGAVLREVRRAPANEGIDDVYAEAPVNEEIDHVASDETSAARDHGQRTLGHQVADLTENLDVEGRLAVRTPMQWSAQRNGGFSTARASRLPRPVSPDLS